MGISPLQAIAGTYGRVSAGGSSLTVDKYKVTPDAVDIKTTNFESQQTNQFGATQTFEEGVMGIAGCTVEWEGNYDAANTPYGGIGVYPGLIGGPVSIYISKTSGKCFTFAQLRYTSVEVDDDVNGTVRYKVRARSNGSWTYPT